MNKSYLTMTIITTILLIEPLHAKSKDTSSDEQPNATNERTITYCGVMNGRNWTITDRNIANTLTNSRGQAPLSIPYPQTALPSRSALERTLNNDNCSALNSNDLSIARGWFDEMKRIIDEYDSNSNLAKFHVSCAAQATKNFLDQLTGALTRINSSHNMNSAIAAIRNNTFCDTIESTPQDTSYHQYDRTSPERTDNEPQANSQNPRRDSDGSQANNGDQGSGSQMNPGRRNESSTGPISVTCPRLLTPNDLETVLSEVSNFDPINPGLIRQLKRNLNRNGTYIFYKILQKTKGNKTAITCTYMAKKNQSKKLNMPPYITTKNNCSVSSNKFHCD